MFRIVSKSKYIQSHLKFRVISDIHFKAEKTNGPYYKILLMEEMEVRETDLA